MLFLNHSGPVTIRFTLLNDSTVTIAIPIMAFANSCASTYGTNSNTNIVRQSWRRNTKRIARVRLSSYSSAS
jgi:hypothetical protein